MLLKFKQAIGGQTKDGTPFHLMPGDEAEWEDEADARRLVQNRIAVPIKEDGTELAVLPRAKISR